MVYHPPEIDSQTGLFIRPQGIYIAGKPKLRIPETQHMYAYFESIGHHITYKWADAGVKKPYREHLSGNLQIAERMLGAAASSDVFIFFQDEDLHGALEERGAFASRAAMQPKGKKLYVVENRLKRESIFDSFAFVEVTDSTHKVYYDLGRISRLAELTKQS